jgi:hypothetical protein
MSDESYWKVHPEGSPDDAAAFSEEDAAREIVERFNDRYETDYAIEEADDATASELMRGSTIALVEAT